MYNAKMLLCNVGILGRVWGISCLGLVFLGLTVPRGLLAQQPWEQATYVTFGVGSSQFTYGEGINESGTVVGIAADGANPVSFVRSSNGTIDILPGLGANCINDSGAIAGEYSVGGQPSEGFIRSSGGTITTFGPAKAPGGTLAISINHFGAVTGWFGGNGFVLSYLRAPDGHFTTFGASQTVTRTYACSINVAGAIAGVYYDANDAVHGFLRAPNGTITAFDAPGAGLGANQGMANCPSISASGEIAGSYFDANSVAHGFVRTINGSIATFDVPGAGTGPIEGTFPTSINGAGEIAGYYTDQSNVLHGFVRAARGDIVTFDAPGAGTLHGQGTVPYGINSAGLITGSVTNTSGSLGFIRTPAAAGRRERTGTSATGSGSQT